jgi:hypothetical protein
MLRGGFKIQRTNGLRTRAEADPKQSNYLPTWMAKSTYKDTEDTEAWLKDYGYLNGRRFIHKALVF